MFFVVVYQGGRTPTGWPHTVQSGKPACQGPEAKPHLRDTPNTPIPKGAQCPGQDSLGVKCLYNVYNVCSGDNTTGSTSRTPGQTFGQMHALVVVRDRGCSKCQGPAMCAPDALQCELTHIHSGCLCLLQDYLGRRYTVDATLFAAPNAGDATFAAAYGRKVNARRFKFLNDLIPQVWLCTAVIESFDSSSILY
jgi:hypothetical protein